MAELIEAELWEPLALPTERLVARPCAVQDMWGKRGGFTGGKAPSDPVDLAIERGAPAELVVKMKEMLAAKRTGSK